MMATAFYDLGMKLNRGAVEGRLANLSQVSSSTITLKGPGGGGGLYSRYAEKIQ